MKIDVDAAPNLCLKKRGGLHEWTFAYVESFIMRVPVCTPYFATKQLPTKRVARYLNIQRCVGCRQLRVDPKT